MKATERFILYVSAIIAGVALSALLTGCGDRTFTINVAEPVATSQPSPVPTPEPAQPNAPDALPPAVDTFGPWNPDEPFNEDDESVDSPPNYSEIINKPDCEPPGNGRGEQNGTPGNGKGRGDEKGCDR